MLEDNVENREVVYTGIMEDNVTDIQDAWFEN